MAYQPSIPTGSVPLNQDYLNIQGNFSSLDTQWQVDHVPLTTAPGPSIGFHKAIHLVPQAPPAAVAGYGELYAQNLNDGIAAGEQLWYQFINGSSVTINTPLTRNFQPTNSTNGVTFLPGGLILQWGQTSKANGGVTNFPLSFPSAVYSVTISVRNATTGSYFVSAIANGNWTYGKSNAGTDNIFWMAIGN